jgi:hypothetical protein
MLVMPLVLLEVVHVTPKKEQKSVAMPAAAVSQPPCTVHASPPAASYSAANTEQVAGV